MAGARKELDLQLAACAPLRSGLDLERAEREVEGRLFGTRRAPITLSRYVLLQEVARGGGGIVFSAFDPELDRKVAVKLIRAWRTRRVADAKTRLLREAQAMARLSHPNVVAVHDVGAYWPADLGIDESRAGDIPQHGVFVVMELVDGVDLRQWLRAGRRSWRDVVAVFRAAAAGLDAAHRASIVHRDFKPSNVIVGTDGRVRVLDFGLARALAPSGSSSSDDATEAATVERIDAPLTGHGAVLGTPAYMSPEQHRGEAVDERSDQYSFCAALYEGIYGRLPFIANDIEGLKTAKSEGLLAPVPPGVRVPSWLLRLITRGLHPLPEGRHPSMAVIHDALRRDRARVVRWALALGTVAVAAGVGAAVAVDDDTACDTVEHDLYGVWDADTRAAVERGFMQTGLPYASSSARAVVADLDRYAARWVEARRAACEAGLMERAVPMAQTTRAMHCLDRRLARLGGLTRLLAAPDAALVERSTLAVSGLPAVEPCARTSGGVGDDGDDVSREALLAIEEKLSRSSGFTYSGRYDEALELAVAALEAAERVDDPGAVASASYELSGVYLARAEFEAAERTARRAMEMAERDLDGEMVVHAMIRLAHIVGAALHRDEEGLMLLDMAQTRASGLELGASAQRGMLASRGLILERGGHYRRALVAHEQALAVERTSPEIHPITEAALLNNVGVAHDRLGDYPVALEFYREALDRQRVLGDSHPAVANALGNVGITQGRLGRFEEAVDTLEQALSISELSVGTDHPDSAWIVGNLGAMYQTLGKRDEALDLFREVVRIATEVLGPDHPTTGQSLGSLAQILASIGNGSEAVEHSSRGVAIAEAHPTNLAGLGRAYHNHGWALWAAGRHAEALAAYDRAFEAYAEAVGAEHPTVGDLFADRGLAHLARSDIPAAITNLERALEIYEHVGTPPLAVAPAEFALARALQGRQPERSRRLAEDALRTFDEHAPGRHERDELIQWLEAMPQ